jgi:hypothetical protein
MSRALHLVPAASVRARLLLAAGVWTAVGCGLVVAGVRWTVLSADPPRSVVGLAAAILVGALKGRFVLARRARANARRIRRAGEVRCIGGAFTWPMWGVAAAMIAVGFALRHSPLPRYWLGLIDVAVGAALAGASLVVWKELLAAPPRA